MATRFGIIHAHSNYSHDGDASLEELRETFLDRGIQFAGMSEHAEDLSADLFDEYVRHCAAVSDSAVQLIPGLEFRFATHRGVHLLALGLRHWIEPQTIEEFFAQTRRNARLTVFAHPILARYAPPEIVLKNIDAIEVWNTRYNTAHLPDFAAVRLLHTLLKRRATVIGTVGLDLHSLDDDSAIRLVVDAAAEDPLVELRHGRFMNIGRTIRFSPTVQIAPTRLFFLRVARQTIDAVVRSKQKLSRIVQRFLAHT